MSTRTRTTTWHIDNAHSMAEFSVKHMMVSTVRGRFESIEGTIDFNENNPEVGSVRAAIDAASINTGEEQRDQHLRSADFFDVENHPKLTFESKRIEPVNGHWKVIGDLTIRGVTHEVAFDTRYEGQIKDAFGSQRAAFEAETEINREDFGLTWNAALETGGVIVGDKVRITLNIAAVQAEE